MIFLLLGVIR